MSEFNVGLKQRLWAIADSQGFIPKDDPETWYRNFGPPWRGWLPRFGTPKGIIWMRTWRTMRKRWILHAPGAISVQGGFSLGGPRTLALLSGAEDSTDWATAALNWSEHLALQHKISQTKKNNFNCIYEKYL